MTRYALLFLLALSIQAGAGESVPESAEKAQPLKAGATVPDVTLKTVAGEPYNLLAKVTEQPSVIVFYRGGWCPYCTKHLKALGEVEEDLLKQGYRIIAVSPDRPAKIKETLGDITLSYDVVSDSEAEAARKFGVAFKVDEATRERYTEYGIDLQDASGHDHYSLPVPSVFITGDEGVIRWVHSDPDYKERLSNEKLTAALEKLKE